MRDRRLAALLAPIFALTGFSALTLQVVWQRVISLHSGVALSSFVTVVAAFLGGLGVGSLLGGRLADRLGPARSLAAFSLANVGIGIFAWFSMVLFYDAYREFAGRLDHPAGAFAFNVVVLSVPTVLMGLSLPLVARAITTRVEEAGPLIGRMYGINTIGAAAGAAVAGWYLLGTFGFENTVRIAGTLNLMAAALIALVWRKVRGSAPATPAPDHGARPAPDGAEVVIDDRAGRQVPAWTWFVLYGITGMVALAFEQLFFRLIDAEMRSNSYSFAHVLTLYLVLFGVGAAIGARFVRRAQDPRTWFLWIQFAVAISASLALVGLVRIMPGIGLDGPLTKYFGGEGYNGGFGAELDLQAWAKIAVVYLLVPVGLMGAPVLLMGAAFPFIQAVIARDVETLGRRTGTLLFANTCGNVAGTLVSGFVLIDVFGTAGTYRLLTSTLALVGLGALLLQPRGRRRTLAGAAALVVLLGTLAASPSNQRLWSFLHGTEDERFTVAEDHSCATTVKYDDEGGAYLHINGSGQNGHPFDDFHVLIGTLPPIAQSQPNSALAIGFGAPVASADLLDQCRPWRRSEIAAPSTTTKSP